jgi:thiamine-phosphate diphosphorylase
MTENGFHVQVVSGRLRPIERSLPSIAAVLDAGISSVQLRDEAASMTAMIKALKQTDSWDLDRIIVNGDPRVAGAYGVRWMHFGSDWLNQMPPFGKFARIGMSAHTLEEAIEAEAMGVDYVTFGHLFLTPSHPGEAGRGIDALADVVERLAIPVLAIGGINHVNVGDVLATGCAGVAVISAILEHADPGYATAKFIGVVEGSDAKPKLTLPPLPEPKKQGGSL